MQCYLKNLGNGYGVFNIKLILNYKFIKVYYRQNEGLFLQKLTRKIFRLKQNTVITTKIKTDPSKLHIKYLANLCKRKNVLYIYLLLY